MGKWDELISKLKGFDEKAMEDYGGAMEDIGGRFSGGAEEARDLIEKLGTGSSGIVKSSGAAETVAEKLARLLKDNYEAPVQKYPPNVIGLGGVPKEKFTNRVSKRAEYPPDEVRRLAEPRHELNLPNKMTTNKKVDPRLVEGTPEYKREFANQSQKVDKLTESDPDLENMLNDSEALNRFLNYKFPGKK